MSYLPGDTEKRTCQSGPVQISAIKEITHKKYFFIFLSHLITFTFQSLFSKISKMPVKII